MKKILILIVASLSLTAFAQTTYTFDKNQARLAFSATHFGVSHVEGNFKNFDVSFKSLKEDLTDAVIVMKAEVQSINTDIEMRDKDLRSANWFDAEKYPEIIFISTSFKKLSDGKYILEGNLTMHGITKPISFDVTYNGKNTNPKTQKQIIGFTVNGKLSRIEFEIGSSSSLSVVGNDVELRSNVEFILNKE